MFTLAKDLTEEWSRPPRIPPGKDFSLCSPVRRPRPTPPDHYFVTPLPRSFAPKQKRAPLFSTTYTLFSIHNSAYPFSFLPTAHSLPKTPGVGAASLTKVLNSRPPVTRLESISFKHVPSNSF